MNDSTVGQICIDAFFDALRLRDIEKSEVALAQLAQWVEREPQWQVWRQYLHGILVFERDRDFAEAERIFLQLLGEEIDPAMQGRVLRALGRGYQVQGRWIEAVAVYRQSLGVFQALTQSIEQARAWKQIAIATRRGFNQGFFDENELEKALSYCHYALDVLKQIQKRGKAEIWLEGSIYNTLGAIHMQLERWDDAIAAYLHDLAICQELGDRYGMGLTYGNLGEIYQKQGESGREKARRSFEQALAIITEFDDVYEEVEALANLAYFYQTSGAWDEAIGYYVRAVEMIEEMRSGISSFEVRSGYFETVTDVYANLINVCLQAGHLEWAFDFMEKARARTFLDSLLANASDESAEASETFDVARTVTLPEVQKALPEETLLLAYFTTGMIEHPDERVRSTRMAQRHRFPEAKTWLVAVTADEAVVYDTALSPNQLLPRRIDEVVERHFLSERMRSMLYSKLIDPAETMLRGKQHLFLAPHGPLHYLPFQALLAKDGVPLLRADGPSIAYCFSASALLHRRLQRSDPPPESCLAMGYNECGALQLRFAEEEAVQVAKLTSGTSMVGVAQKKSALIARAPRYRLLHFSCHGEFNANAPLQSFLQLAREERLTAHEVLLNLQLNADLVTMSACESGLSKVRRGDELTGFTHSFMQAGAHNVIASLWRVDEISTTLFMRAFYREIQSGADFASALQQAQVFLQRITREEAAQILGHWFSEGDDSEIPFAQPFYWAPFVLFTSLQGLYSAL